MRNVFLIARREYLERVRTKSFVLTTVLFPFFMFAITVLPSLFANGMLSNSSKHLAVVASDSQTAELIAASLREAKREVRQKVQSRLSRKNATAVGAFTVDVDTDTSAAERASLTGKVRQKQLDGIVWVTDEALASGKVDLITRDVSSIISNDDIKENIMGSVRRVMLKRRGFTDEEVKKALDPVEFNVMDETGGRDKNASLKFFGALIMVYVLFFSVFFYGINVMRSVLEEKTSRVMEVMLATARPEEMMAGKILGVGAVGLTQVGIWGLAGIILTSSALVASAEQFKGAITVQTAAAFPVFFLLGYLVYSSLYAAIGSMVNSDQEAQQIQIVVTLPLIFSVMIMFNTVNDPNSSLAFWTSLFPLTSPMIMYSRIAVQPPPLWQIALSIGLLAATIYGLVLLCGRIYRVGILMYGKKPTLPEILKWIRYA